MTGPPPTTDDVRWMRRALAVGEVARGRTRPNPFVGAVVVADDHEVAVGATGPAGTAHAEVRALEQAGERAHGATLVVTLEPCAHVGRTAACTAAIAAAGIARVVVGLADPNPLAAGGAERLRAAGIDVTVGVLDAEVAAQQAVFLTTVEHARPHVTLKLAQLPDGATRPDQVGRRWLTGPVARQRVHRLRAEVDAVLVGSGTALADDPALTVRDAAPGPRPPRAVVVDRRGRSTPDLEVVRPGTIVLTASTADPDWRAVMASAGVEVVVADDLGDGLRRLRDLDVAAVLAEPGTTLGRALVAADLVDTLVLHVAGTRVDDDRPWTPAVSPPPEFLLETRRRLGDDVEWTWRRPLGDHFGSAVHELSRGRR
ncbi:bifunctional diaminohydroxyphosphoribosylaminopyrimidine deaminase/5-amino-6-(5-phosphoribosylamino)uracil reductase RibD [Salsipaludibacter albus]|uniref:bifunctional diaminohydroxyphosphoribosylaminopyrimidine deaminase/5-amino-6-(5-phosphoribosylamino)uracil reductase RibD n=1 Tax=Salsipaludibacter albus TaxID=2849650 RepID=UPI001EE421E5|nr:bifunctional diaminohydroxyphosphoribosylaminopyrimidine deaminase/5-amino-6-(5-phosphoribosylamino)uracil reductase RibD [Salsipaludibacter albus]